MEEGQVDGMRLTVLVDDSKNPLKPELEAKHGLSMFIELRARKRITSLLMDTGQSADIVSRNAEKLGVDLARVDAILLSHGHYDHTGGLLGILGHINKAVPIIAHPSAFEQKFALKRKGLKKIGIPFGPSEIGRSNGVLSLSRDPQRISPGTWVSGEIERVVPFEEVKGFKARRQGKLMDDQVLDDQALFVDVRGKGLVVITGCAHAGLINTIVQGLKVTGSKVVYAVVGGFHLVNASAARIRATVQELQRLDPRAIMPCHCTGRKAIKKLAEAFGEKCRQLRTGDVVTF